ncbi:multidrug effflux MFS transporter [Pseudomonas putida]|uniref:multidrug effflux MFS transporter n=1 Tax=Pseudomonas putida TaxID=303 RepID=UPI0015774185|nr:multidrug effflux MFS transporter [Pseudomonas putida]NTY90375.1 multidrug effflux MFS transporter [Pseudomonas putida]NTY98917.1 multidrug effflux MFS transporter [Pseudomonas putida]NTZ21200.1 multidrug effflux MFS transporter [Pseudomonas putida]NTZ53281.1 multidrug effflux MFS transporter [Pseudomonas putida]NTZ65069.1 multidrug effflux MFS transporter [Pseudomonas putida]
MSGSVITPVPVRIAVALGLIGALGPSAVDMYLSSLPEIAREFETSFASVQLTLTFFLLAMGAGQLLFGPIVDAYGRRKPLLAGLAIFTACSLGAAWAPSLEVLIGFRFVQGLGSALTLVVIMSMVRDISTGVAATKLFAMLMTIEGVAPILAPAAGGFVDAHFGWRAVMLVLAALGVAVLSNSWVALPETLAPNKRVALSVDTACKTYLAIAKDRNFLMPTLAVSAVFFFLFAYIGGATLVYQESYGLSTQQFGLLFGATGVTIIFGAMVAGRMVSRLGLGKLSMLGVSCMAIGATISLGAAASEVGLAGVVAGMAIALFGLGIAESTLMSLVMSSQEKALGSTAALLGAFQLSISSTATPVAGLVLEYGPVAWVALLAASAIVVCVLTKISVPSSASETYNLAEH